MDCQHLHRSTGLTSLWRLRFCPECRAAQAVDKRIARGVAQMQAEPAPVSGQAGVLAGLTAVFPPPPRSRPRPFWRRRMLPSGIVTVGLAAVGYGWVSWSNIDPNVTLPARVMPPVNAYDTYQAAYKAELSREYIAGGDYGRQRAATKGWVMTLIQRPDVIRIAEQHHLPRSFRPQFLGGTPGLPEPMPQIDWDASRVDRKYARLYSSMLVPRPEKEIRKDQKALDLFFLRQNLPLLQKNAPVLALLRKGLQEPYMSPGISEKGIDPGRADGYRRLITLLELEQTFREIQEDWYGAANSGLDTLQFSEGTGGYQGVGWCRTKLCEEIPHLTATQARAVAQRLEKIIALHVPLADAYQESKWAYQLKAEQLFHDPNWRFKSYPEANFDPLGYDPIADRMHPMMNWLRLLPYSKRHILDLGSSIMDQRIAVVRQPYIIKPRQVPVPEDPVNTSLLDQNQPRNVVAQNLESERLDEAVDRAQNSMLLVYAALQAYYREHGAYPATLSQLVPRYLNAVPEDPFALQAPLHYRQKGATFVLYSIGPDGIDQQGTPVSTDILDAQGRVIKEGTTPTGPTSVYLTPQSKGDIVAGLDCQ